MASEIKHPDPKMHLYISITKSVVRIGTSMISAGLVMAGSVPFAVMILAVGYGLAEVIGVVEELV